MKAWAVFALSVALGAGVWAAAQQNPSPPLTPAPAQTDDQTVTFTTEATEVRMLFTVTDKKGRFVTNLTKNDFEVSEDKRPQRIRTFSAESDLPLRLAILVDTSGSIRDRLRFEQEAALDFISSVVKPQVDKAMVVSFDTETELRSDLVDDMRALAAAIRDLRAGGGTALYDAVFLACRDKLALDHPMHNFRRAIVIVSDGEDDQSNYTRDQALEMAQKVDVVIYAISTNISRVETDGDKVLKYLTEQTGGMAYFPFKVEDLGQSFINIANELRHQYSISYRPEPLITDGKFHRIQLRVKDRKDLVVRVREGYIAPKL